MLSFTQQERRAALFLITIALVGIGINFLGKISSGAKVMAGICQDINKIDLNTADKDLLMRISGIGVKLAQRIIKYREKEGGFKEVGELKNIRGITDYKYEKIREFFIIK